MNRLSKTSYRCTKCGWLGVWEQIKVVMHNREEGSSYCPSCQNPDEGGLLVEVKR